MDDVGPDAPAFAELIPTPVLGCTTPAVDPLPRSFEGELMLGPFDTVWLVGELLTGVSSQATATPLPDDEFIFGSDALVPGEPVTALSPTLVRVDFSQSPTGDEGGATLCEGSVSLVQG